MAIAEKPVITGECISFHATCILLLINMICSSVLDTDDIGDICLKIGGTQPEEVFVEDSNMSSMY